MDSWMYRIVQNLWLDDKRRTRTRGTAIDPDDAHLSDDGKAAQLPEDRMMLAQVRAAMAEGLSGVTHLFNAMAPMTARVPGLAGTALTDPGLFVGLIADGLTVGPALFDLAVRAIGPSRLMLVTDAMPSVGAPSDRFMLMGREIVLRDGILLAPDGTLAGAHLGQDEAVRNAVTLTGASLRDALAMASRTPATFLGLAGSHGRIAPSCVADLVALDPALQVLGTWIGGVWETA
jgi:N-acetylglucosamine-6-phosphate deacetylase